MHYLYTGVMEPNQELPQMSAVGYIDDQLFCHYDPSMKRAQHQALWMEKKENAQYSDRETRNFQDFEQVFRVDFLNLTKRYNRSSGIHILQVKIGCELRKDGGNGGYMRYAIDGRDFLSFDMDTFTWAAVNTVEAKTIKEKWDANLTDIQYRKAYLETCIKRLQRYLDYGEKTLLKKEPPVVKVMRNASGDNLETLICEAHGFYPREINATWRRDGEILDQETFYETVAPNSDGTYHVRLSVDIDPKEREHYRCHVVHAGLPEPLVLAWEEPGGESQPANMIFIVGAILVSAVVLGAAGIAFFIMKRWVCQGPLENVEERNGYAMGTYKGIPSQLGSIPIDLWEPCSTTARAHPIEESKHPTVLSLMVRKLILSVKTLQSNKGFRVG